jgi:hypothetical protein
MGSGSMEALVMARDHGSKRGRSSGGTPNSSASTKVGSGEVYSSTTLGVSPTAQRCASWSTRPRTNARMRGSRPDTRSGVKPFEMRRRSAVCCGGSIMMKVGASPSSFISSRMKVSPRAEEKLVKSRVARKTSSKRESTQKSPAAW